jgi:TonB family protein
MSREEIILYMLEHSDEKVCGRMNRPFVDIHHDDLPLIIETLSKQGGNRSFLLLALICMSLVSCSTPDTTDQTNNIKPKVESNAIEGKIAMTDTTKNAKATTEERTSSHRVIPPEILPVVDPDPLPEPYPYLEGDIALIEEPLALPPPSQERQEEEILSYAEVMPEYPGGVKELFSFIQRNMKYPEIEKENGIQGTVYVQFIVSKEGVVSNPKILRGVNGAPGFDKEVIRIVKLLPNWIPGENGGKKVNVYYNLPVKFRLD